MPTTSTTLTTPHKQETVALSGATGDNNEKYTLDRLNAMIPAEFENEHESGDEEPRQLSDSVTGLVELPLGWRVNAEYRVGFGGQFPVQNSAGIT